MTKVIKVGPQHILAFIAKPHKDALVESYYSFIEDVEVYIPFSSYSTLIQDLHKVKFPNGVTRFPMYRYNEAVKVLDQNPQMLVVRYYLDLVVINMGFIIDNLKYGDDHGFVKAMSCGFDGSTSSKSFTVSSREVNNLELDKGWSRPPWMDKELFNVFTPSIIDSAIKQADEMYKRKSLSFTPLSELKNRSKYLNQVYNLILMYLCLTLRSDLVMLNIETIQ